LIGLCSLWVVLGAVAYAVSPFGDSAALATKVVARRYGSDTIVGKLQGAAGSKEPFAS